MAAIWFTASDQENFKKERACRNVCIDQGNYITCFKCQAEKYPLLSWRTFNRLGKSICVAITLELISVLIKQKFKHNLKYN